MQAERDQNDADETQCSAFFSQLRNKLRETEPPSDSAVISDQLLQFAERQKQLERRELMLSQAEVADSPESPSEKVYFTSELYRTQKVQERSRREQLVKQA